MTDERPNPDVFFTDEEVAEMKAKGLISEDRPEANTSIKCLYCDKEFKDGESIICSECLPF